MKSREQEEMAAWSLISQFVAEHPTVCHKARYIRAIVNWWPGLGEWASTTRIGRTLSWFLTPMWFGARVIMCLECHTIEFESKWAKRLFSLITRSCPENHPHGLFFFGVDVEHLSEEDKARFNLETAEIV